jgi:hypothetical protein
MTTRTSNEALQAAWAALLRGDTLERDRQCERAKHLNEAEVYAAAMQRALSIDFYVNTRGVAYPARELARRAGAIQ